MKKNGDHEWIMLISTNLEFSSRFLESFSNQLADQVRNAINLDIRASFYLDFREYKWDEETNSYKDLDRDEFPYFNEENIAYVDGDITGPDNFGYFVRIAWKCDNHPNERILPNNPLNPEDNHKIRVWWSHIPLDELREYNSPLPSHIPIVGNLSFDVQWHPSWDSTLPDLNIYLKVSNHPSAKELDSINKQLWHVLMNPDEKYLNDVITWITSRRIGGQDFSVEEAMGMFQTAFVKYSSGIVEGEDFYRLGLDFQLACDATVAYWISALDKISEQLSIEYVKVGNL